MSLTYKEAGVDIDAGNRLVDRIRAVVQTTTRPEVVSGIGGFGGLFKLPSRPYREPILVSGTDGVGTKLKLAHRLNKHDTIGIDLVAMCVNDVLVQGAEPLFFLDYFATGKLEVDTAAAVIEGIAEGCRQSGAALIGGETAEMPGMYGNDEYDLAGFCVGIVDRDELLDGSKVTSGDLIIGLQSTGFHSNGYSLVNKVIDQHQCDLDAAFDNSTLGECLLAPTRIYVKVIQAMLQRIQIHALCHITGGGLTENIPRILPDNTSALFELGSWQRPAVFDWIENLAEIEREEMLRVFNCGIGMAVIVPKQNAEAVISIAADHDIRAFVIGEIASRKKPDASVIYRS